jgi:hypothetical protein
VSGFDGLLHAHGPVAVPFWSVRVRVRVRVRAGLEHGFGGSTYRTCGLGSGLGSERTVLSRPR